MYRFRLKRGKRLIGQKMVYAGRSGQDEFDSSEPLHLRDPATFELISSAFDGRLNAPVDIPAQFDGGNVESALQTLQCDEKNAEDGNEDAELDDTAAFEEDE